MMGWLVKSALFISLSLIVLSVPGESRDAERKSADIQSLRQESLSESIGDNIISIQKRASEDGKKKSAAKKKKNKGVRKSKDKKKARKAKGNRKVKKKKKMMNRRRKKSKSGKRRKKSRNGRKKKKGKKKRKGKNGKKKSKGKKGKKKKKGNRKSKGLKKKKKGLKGKKKNKNLKQANCAADEANTQCFLDVYTAINFEETSASNLETQKKRIDSFAKIMANKNKKNGVFQITATDLLDAIGSPDNVSCGDHNSDTPGASSSNTSTSNTTINKNSAKSVYTSLMTCNESIDIACNLEKLGIYNNTLSETVVNCFNTMAAFKDENKVCAAKTTASETCACYGAQTNTEIPKIRESGCNKLVKATNDQVKNALQDCIKVFGNCRNLQVSAVDVAGTCAAGKVESAAVVDKTIVKWNE